MSVDPSTPPKRPDSVKVTRFAPSPTGYLHLGHALSALYVWGLGRAHVLTVLLRIEDHDLGRCRDEFEAATFTDLAWLGFHHDNRSLRYGEPSPFRQSNQRQRYDEALETLAKTHHVYGCDCSRKSLGDADADGERRYSGHCRQRGLDWRRPGIGVRLELGDETVRFTDVLHGSLDQTPSSQCGDLLLRDRHGLFTYQFGVVVDDLDQGVDLVIRGDDLLPSTGRQILLGKALGRLTPPRFAHHPLLKDQTGRKLGKRFWSEAVGQRRVAGAEPAALLGEAAALAGLIDTARPITVEELAATMAKEVILG